MSKIDDRLGATLMEANLQFLERHVLRFGFCMALFAAALFFSRTIDIAGVAGSWIGDVLRWSFLSISVVGFAVSGVLFILSLVYLTRQQKELDAVRRGHSGRCS
jgi:uncharacterized membrane protein (DUF485 family)